MPGGQKPISTSKGLRHTEDEMGKLQIIPEPLFTLILQ
ncbi:unnamed protein product [Strongylus vulgaris]|uniref:Uncharacterized protein n=1 Tax=Strongylus vulgaris TaxID=40348 RepID=A0A3P7K257_STRVU|nr:unnamed protein product [Strongylus vulgaris]